MRSNTLCWNPMEAYYFTCSNEDYKWVEDVDGCYSESDSGDSTCALNVSVYMTKSWYSNRRILTCKSVELCIIRRLCFPFVLVLMCFPVECNLIHGANLVFQSLHIWHEVPGAASHSAHGPRLCCAGCWLLSNWEGVCIGQFWQNHPNLPQGWWPQQVGDTSLKEWPLSLFCVYCDCINGP